MLLASHSPRRTLKELRLTPSGLGRTQRLKFQGNSRQIVHLVGGGQDMLGGDQSSSAQIDIRRGEERCLPGIGSEAGLSRSGGGGSRWWREPAAALIASRLAAGHQAVAAGQRGRGGGQ